MTNDSITPKTTSQPERNELVGSVLVVGGGIAGMQTSLDLADQGFKVFIAEEKTAIGGHMAQLDKTFPTNDCAMCNISPKLVDTGRHENIEILTNTTIEQVQGELGNFRVSLKQNPRYIHTDICIGCGDCIDVCPVTIEDDYEEGLKSKKAIYRLYSQAVPSAFAIDKLGVAPCRDGCPAGQRAQGYIALIAQGRYREAYRVIKEDNPFPSVCGRTCHHPCESKCTRKFVDESVGIMDLKRFVVDYTLAYGREKVELAPRTRPEWIAVVGAGPAGLTTAHDLAKLGYGVTIYEALPVPGGMMRVGIPAHRLPKGVLQQDIDDILALGINLKINSPIKDPTRLLDEGYNAVCLATGISSDDHKLGIKGEEADGVIPAARFLRKINLGEPISIGKRIAVVGGGITALDAAAVARRLGADIVYLLLDRPRGELPAYHWEVAAVEAEGIHLYEKVQATKILTQNGRVCGIELKHGEDTLSLEVDTVIGTVSQYTDLNFLDSKYDDLQSDKITFESEIPGIFVVGGRKTGASYIINAVALGHQVATSIHHYIQQIPLSSSPPYQPTVVKFTREEIAQEVREGRITKRSRAQPALLPMEERVTSFREVVLGLTERQAREEAQRCLQCGICSECLQCIDACGLNAIDHDMVEASIDLKVGSIILAPGFHTYEGHLTEEYGLGRYSNVVTSLQFERLLSASGPTFGKVKRPSDGQIPTKIAFLQCVGSRDQEHDYCSAVCCMYATKEATIAKEHHPNMDIHIFMMDVRAFSKGYQSYYKRSQEKYGINYARCRISGIREESTSKNLILKYAQGNQVLENEFDLVVLSVGMEIPKTIRELAGKMGIETDEFGFCKTDANNPLQTSIPGIFAVGPFREPKDIPESVIDASGAAAVAAGLLSNTRWAHTIEKQFPPEIDVSEEPPRIGVFVCHCGSNIGGFLDVKQVADYAGRLENVVHTEDNLYTCSQDSIAMITERVKEYNLNRVVVASCSPLTHAPLFQDSIRAAGLNPYLFEMANIRNQCSWVHSDDWDAATIKAKELVSMAVSKARRLEPRQTVDVPVQQSALILGGGIAGMTAAISLSEQQFPVHLVEKRPFLGGIVGELNISSPLDEEQPKEILKKIKKKVQNNPYITTYLNSEVIASKGQLGNFTSHILSEEGIKKEISHGVTILATGAQEYRGPEYGFGQNPRIITQLDLGKMISQSDELNNTDQIKQKLPESVVMIQCIGPAEKYCSRICCTVALKNALSLKEKKPDCQIAILYKDIRVFGFGERLYTEARKRGVLFIRYDDQNKPEVIFDQTAEGESNTDKDYGSYGDDIHVLVHDPFLDRQISLRPQYLILSMPVVPNPDIQTVSNIFKVPIDENGFFQEAHVKLRPVDFSTNGIFMAGMAHYPKFIDETIVQAQAAASRASRILCQQTRKSSGQVAIVDESLCTGCLTCLRVCPFDVPVIQSDLLGVGGILGAAFIDSSVCQGCGSCAAACPAHAIQLANYTDIQLQEKVNALISPVINLSING